LTCGPMPGSSYTWQSKNLTIFRMYNMNICYYVCMHGLVDW
jgi:hypothetical protein